MLQSFLYVLVLLPTVKQYPSKYYDMKAGKRFEIDTLNGAIIRLAKEKGFAAPVKPPHCSPA